MLIFRYLTREVYSTLLATTLVLLFIFIVNQFIHYLSQAAAGGLPARAVMQLMSLQVPLLLGYLLPLGLFIGILLAYGRLYVDNEMTVLSACGISKMQIYGITFTYSVVIMALVTVLTLWMEPKLAWYRDHIFAEAQIASPIETLIPGRFQTLLQGQWVFYVGDSSRDRMNLHDVFVAQMPNTPGQGWTVVSARGGQQVTDMKTGDKFLKLTQGYRYVGIPGRLDYQIVKYDEDWLKIQSGVSRIKDTTEFTPTTELWQQRKKNQQAAAELQWRLTMPVATLMLALLAVPLSQVKPGKGRYAKLLPAILIYVVYADMIFVAQAAIQKGTLRPFPGIWWVHLGMLGVVLLFMGNYIGWSRIVDLLKRRKKIP